ncbi:MAG TPA: OmpH family outer membrane protein [Chthonomonadaceae bacterium]|nr:OmpH family outer membrane protein [Chthonomonadaceae bacterium]
MSIRNFVPIALLCLALLLSVGALVGRANPAREMQGGAPLANDTIAVVDMDRVYNASDAPQAVEQRALEMQNEVAQNISSIQAVPYLEQNELVEYITLLTKDKPTDTEQARIKALKALSDQRAQELQTLQTKKDSDLTAADKNRMNELVGESRTLERILPNIMDSMRTDQATHLEAFRHDEMIKLRATVAQVAKERGIAHVFDANALVYSATDLTPQVVERVSKHQK